MWNLLLALEYDLPTMVDLRAFWVHVRLTSMHNKDTLFSFGKEVAPYCVDLRLDHLNWMNVADLRRLLAKFHSLVRLHIGNVALSKSTLINDINTLFPFLKQLNLLIALDADVFEDISAALSQIKQLDYLSLVLEDKKGKCGFHRMLNFLSSIGGYLSDQNLRLYLRLIPEYISNLAGEYKLVSVEENGYGIKHRMKFNDIPEETLFDPINLSLISTLEHLIVSFRPMLNMDLRLALKDSTMEKLPLQTLVLPCVPSTSDSIDIFDLQQLRTLDIGALNVKNRAELTRLDQLLLSHSIRNLTIHLNEWQPARLVVVGKEQKTSIQSNVLARQDRFPMNSIHSIEMCAL